MLYKKLLERDINRIEVKEVILEGEVVESYEEDKPFPSALFFKLVNNRPLHVVAAFDEMRNKAYIITSYEPDLIIFENDYRTRKKK